MLTYSLGGESKQIPFLYEQCLILITLCNRPWNLHPISRYCSSLLNSHSYCF